MFGAVINNNNVDVAPKVDPDKTETVSSCKIFFMGEEIFTIRCEEAADRCAA